MLDASTDMNAPPVPTPPGDEDGDEELVPAAPTSPFGKLKPDESGDAPANDESDDGGELVPVAPASPFGIRK